MKVAALVSGGVDSSVALALLKEQGYDVTAFYLKIWLEDELSYLGNCPWEQDLEYVRGVCKQLNVPLEVVSMQQPYWNRVVSYTIDEVKAGRTPNPDVLCNQQVKFGAFYDHIGDEFAYIATGHYAQVEHTKDGSLLKNAPDPIKDQTYFLCWLSPQQLSRVLFPIGHLQKEQVRQLAQDLNLPNKDRKDSQGICFLGKFKFSDFLRAHLGDQVGSFVEHETGDVVGDHKGFWYYTIGQRQGIGLSGGPWYVVGKEASTNTVFISKQYYDVEQHKKGMMVSGMNWLCPITEKTIHLDVKFRHGQNFHSAMIEVLGDDRIKITLDQESKQGIAAGQFAVLYQGSLCFGGGVIDQAF